MKVVIIEDEKPSARKLQRMLSNLDIEVSVLLHSVEESIEWFAENEPPDLILLDIQLSDGLSFEIFDEIEVHSAVIFATAFDEYALQAFKLNSIDYLLKPIDPTSLKSAISKFKKRMLLQTHQNINFSDVKKMLQLSDPTYKKRFSIKMGNRIKIIEVSEITLFYSENKGTYIQTTEGRSYLIDQSLDQITEQTDPISFFRVNRKFVVALDFIEDIISYSNSRLLLNVKKYEVEEVIVARERVGEFKKWINS